MTLVAQNLGFDNVIGCLIADKSLTDRHLIEIDVTGPYNQNLNLNFSCLTVRSNPAGKGNVNI
jgi:aspartate dehydrogenase